MIYLVTNNKDLLNSDLYEDMSITESLNTLNSWECIQFDTETSGRDPHVCKVLCAQFGHNGDQIVVDTTTVDLKLYKDILENKLIIGHNLKFDLQFLYNYNIIPTHVYDTMIVEQLLYLGYSYKTIRFNLKEVAMRYLNVDIDKTIRGEIVYRGLDAEVIKYAAGDVTYLEDIKTKQEDLCKKNKCITGANLENSFVPALAYLEWCGIRLDVNKWKLRKEDNEARLNRYQKELNDFIVKHASDKSYFPFIDFTLFGPECAINWNSAQQVVPLLQFLGFNTKVRDKNTNEYKDSVEGKNLVKQKGINDEFLNIYLGYKDAQKDLSTYGTQYIDAINPNTGRIHTTFRQLGADTGRMACGSRDNNYDLAQLKHISPDRCKYVQLQNLPRDQYTRASFIPNDGNLMVSCDFSALESRLGADIYQEHSMIKEFLYGSGDMHSLCAYMVYKEIPRDTPIKEIKERYPQLRTAVKGIELDCEDSLLRNLYVKWQITVNS